MAYDILSPGEPERSDYQAALVAMTIANAAPSSRKRRPFKLEDFLLRFVPKKVEPKTASEIHKKLLMWKKMMDKRFKKTNDTANPKPGKKRWRHKL